MSPQKMIKKEALGRLRGNWPTALGILCLPAAVWTLVAFASEYICYCGGVFNVTDSVALFASPVALACLAVSVLFRLLVAFFVLRPLLLGVQRWWCGLAFDKNMGAGMCLYYFSRAEYGHCIKYSFRMLLRLLLRAAPIALVLLVLTGLCGVAARPAVLTEFFTQGITALQEHEISAMNTAFAILLPLGILVFVLLCIRFLLSDYLFITERELNSMTLSAQRMRGYKKHSARVLLSFLWWILLSLFAIPLLFTVPYMGMALTVLCKWIVYNQRHSAE